MVPDELIYPTGAMLASMLGVSGNTIVAYTKKGMPVLETGTKGKPRTYCGRGYWVISTWERRVRYDNNSC
jgi:hypothetical protein